MMKTAFAALALATITMSAQAGVILEEGFDNVAGLAASGWQFKNLSTPLGPTVGWFQGDGVFDAQSGEAATSYAAANYGNAAPGGSLHSWLLTPILDVSHGVDISFYLRAAGDGYNDQFAYGFSGFAGAGALTVVSPVPTSGWTLYTAHLDATDVGTARFAFEYFGKANTANYVGLDTLTITAPDGNDVPEPASIALVTAGLLGLGAARRRAAPRSRS